MGASFARIFFRSSINQGLVLIEAPDFVREFEFGDDFALDLENGTLKLMKKDGGAEKEFAFPKLPPSIKAIRASGGLLEHTRAVLAKNVADPKK